MKQLTEEQIIQNWERFYNLILSTFKGERKDNLIKLADALQDRMILAPASSKEHYHNAYPGGYIDHVLHVYDAAQDVAKVWSKYSECIDYTEEEITLACLFHDLGKIGDETNEFYMPQDNEWRRNTLGEIYRINPEITNMDSADRSLYLLQYFGVILTQNEWITIKIHDGLYDEANTKYYKVMSDSNSLKSHLPHVIHQADIIAYRTEYEEWRTNHRDGDNKNKSKTKKYYTKKAAVTETINKPILDSFFKETDKQTSSIEGVNFDGLFEDKPKES